MALVPFWGSAIMKQIEQHALHQGGYEFLLVID
jgi:hypothetical protein